MSINHTNRITTRVRFVGETNFNAQVLQSKHAVLVAFWSPWSRPCQVIDPVLLEFAQARRDVEVVKVNADANPNLSLWYGVQHVPSLLCFMAGQLRGQLVGTVNREAILKLLTRDGEGGRRAVGHAPGGDGGRPPSITSFAPS